VKACIVTIGDELLIGQVVNTNASYLGRKLFEAGIPVQKVISVPDDEKQIVGEFKAVFNNFDVILVSGGLGPTHDDITKKCICRFFGTKLIFDKKVFLNIKNIFKRRRISMPQSNVIQAMVPALAKILKNNSGTAPGLLIEKKGKVFISLPGVPLEVIHLYETHIHKYLKKKFRSIKDRTFILNKTLHTIGISESMLSGKIGDFCDSLKHLKGVEFSLAYLPGKYEVRLRITVKSQSREKANSGLKHAVNYFRSKAGNFIYSYDEEFIEQVVVNLLKRQNLTLSVAESCTGGLVSSKITNVSGCSKYFLNGVITYSNTSKQKLLGVKNTTLKIYGAVSKQVALQMAKGIRKFASSDIGLSTTGIAGPTGATKKKPVGLVWIGYADKSVVFAKDFVFTKDRLRNKEIMSKMALEILRRKLLNI
jgi:nicotinamide-nucleotide amidase